MPKVIFSLLVALGYLMIPVRSKEISKYNDCKWFSEVEPEAYFQEKKYIPGTSRNLTRADLIYKGIVVRSIVYGKPNGQKSRWWAYEKSMETNGGRKNIKMIGGGNMILFFGNVPENSILNSKKSLDVSKKVLLVGLGRDLYYSRRFMGKEFNLVLAAGGLWEYGDDCVIGR